MKKQLLSALIFASFSFNVNSDSENCNAGYDNLEHLGSCLGGVVDSSMGILANLPSDVQMWSDKQHAKAKQKLEIIKDDICNNENSVKEIIVEKIIYVDRIIKVPAKVHERRCITKKQSDRFGNINEVTSCTEWK